MHARKLIFTALVGLLPAGGTLAQESNANALELINQNCVRCHDNSVYGRPEGARRVNNWDELHKQVRRCELMLGLKWFDEDVAVVSSHLNSQFYKFPVPQTQTAPAE